MIRLKDKVSLDNCDHRVFGVIFLAAPIWRRYNADDLWVTAANEAGHTTNPDPRKQKHRLPDGTCQAVDLRTHNLSDPDHRDQAVKELREVLGGGYLVLLENPGKGNEHCHVEVR